VKVSTPPGVAWTHDPDGPDRLTIWHHPDRTGTAELVVTRGQLEYHLAPSSTVRVHVPAAALVAFGQDWHDAGLAVHAAWDRYRRASDPVAAARALVELDDALSGLATYLPPDEEQARPEQA
jgi:hypothetical protein